jgi:predicted DNA-binding protein (MmcQ/YjbR family)
MDPARIAERLRKRALAYPDTYEEAPWGDRVVKVRGKIFLFCGVHEGQLSLSVKLPRSGREVLREPWAKPTPYGLGKSGWVSAQFPKGKAVDEERVAKWIDESYRALAPKRLVAQLGESGAAKPAAAGKKLSARVMLLCHDPLRSERALSGLAAAGVKVTATAKLADVRKQLAKLDAVIVDVGRLQEEGLSLAREIDTSDHEVHVFVAGIRDAKSRKRAAEAATSAELFKQPPGDRAVVAAVRKTLGG